MVILPLSGLQVVGLGLLVVCLRTQFRKPKFRRVSTVGPDSWLYSWATVFRLFARTVEIVNEAYRTSKGRALKIPEMNGWHLLLTNIAAIDEMRRAPENLLSFDEAMNESLQVDYTLGTEIAHNPYHVPILRHQLTRNIASLFDEIHEEVVESFRELIPAVEHEWVSVPGFDTVVQAICRTTNRTIAGLPVCRDPDYVKLNIRFTLEIIIGGITIKLFPAPLKPLAARLLTNVPKSIDQGVKHLGPIIRERYAQMEMYGDNWQEKPNDLLQWMMDVAEGDEKSERNLTLRILSINFAAIHTTSMALTNALFYLAANPEYSRILREEIDQIVAEDGWTKLSVGRMRKVDSYIKECLRIYGLASIGMTRKAMRDYTFQDGTFAPKGSLISVATRAIHSDPELYEDPEAFNPWRFVDMRSQEGEDTKHQLVATALDYMPFGHGKHACPGRFFAATELKTMLAYLVVSYDIKFENEGQIPEPTKFFYSVSPNRKAQVMFRKRKIQS